MDDLPSDVIIIIINFLPLSDVINLMKLFNHAIFEACRFYKKIYMGLNFRFVDKLPILNYFYQPEELVIKNGSCVKNNFCQSVINNEWRLKKLVLNNIRNLDSDIIYELLKCQKKLKTLELFLCNVLEKRHLLIINENIEFVTLRNNSFNFEDIKCLTKYKKLKKLDLSYSHFLYNISINELFFDNLEILHLSNVQLLIDERFYLFLGNLTKLRNLDLDFVITNYQTFYEINKICPKLEKLTMLNSINLIADGDPRPLLTNKWNNMVHLNLSYCLISDENIINIVDNIPNIKTLNLNQTGTTDTGMVYIATHLKKIEKFYISNIRITNLSANNISIHMNKLKELDISQTIINTYYLKKILKNNNIEKLYIMDCQEINSKEIWFAVKKIII